MMRPAEVPAAFLVDNRETLAPVSGCRCRCCGANARSRPADQPWTVWNRAAYCPDCRQELADRAERNRAAELAPALAVDCPSCRAKAGERCQNYRGQNKQICPDRGRPAPPPVPEVPAGPRQLDLFA